MLIEMVKNHHKMWGEVKAMKNEIKENVKGPTVKRIQILEQKEEIINQNRMKTQEFKKNEERLSNLGNNFKCSNIQIIGVPDGEEEEQEIENLPEKIMKDN